MWWWYLVWQVWVGVGRAGPNTEMATLHCTVNWSVNPQK